MNPGFLQRYQVWLFTYPSGEPYLQSAQLLRTSLREAQVAADPQGMDCALCQMVLAGHSQGGVLVKTMVTWSDDKVEKAILRVPFNQLNLPADERERFSSYLFFEPQPCVKRVIYICTNFTGVTVPESILARLSGLVVQQSEEEETWRQARKANPFAVRHAFRRLPTSVDMFLRHQPLHYTLRELRVNPCVVSHCIIGTGSVLPALSPSDRIVPVRSARTSEAESTFYVNLSHNKVPHAPETSAEIQRILCEHLSGSMGR
jgi:hypothetical protein